jgi:hypothetical protein
MNWTVFLVIAAAFGAVAWLRGEAVVFVGAVALAYMLIAGGAAVGWSPW